MSINSTTEHYRTTHYERVLSQARLHNNMIRLFSFFGVYFAFVTTASLESLLEVHFVEVKYLNRIQVVS